MTEIRDMLDPRTLDSLRATSQTDDLTSSEDCSLSSGELGRVQKIMRVKPKGGQTSLERLSGQDSPAKYTLALAEKIEQRTGQPASQEVVDALLARAIARANPPKWDGKESYEAQMARLGKEWESQVVQYTDLLEEPVEELGVIGQPPTPETIPADMDADDGVEHVVLPPMPDEEPKGPSRWEDMLQRARGVFTSPETADKHKQASAREMGGVALVSSISLGKVLYEGVKNKVSSLQVGERTRDIREGFNGISWQGLMKVNQFVERRVAAHREKIGSLTPEQRDARKKNILILGATTLALATAVVGEVWLTHKLGSAPRGSSAEGGWLNDLFDMSSLPSVTPSPEANIDSPVVIDGTHLSRGGGMGIEQFTILAGEGGETHMTPSGFSDLKHYMDGYTVRESDDQGVWGIACDYLKKNGVSNPSDYQIDAVKDQILEHSRPNPHTILYAGDKIRLR